MSPSVPRRSNGRMLPGALLFCICSGLLNSAQAAEDDGWPDAQQDWSLSAVNEGQLRFIEPVLDRAVLHSDTRLWLTAASLLDGWVDMLQCYRNLDAVDRTEIVYAYSEMENLTVTRAQNIGHYRLTPTGIELDGVARDAELCLRSRVRVLRRLSDRGWRMSHGPYHRRFLDGYYPYHLSLSLQYPREKIRLERIEPAPRPGFEVKNTPTGFTIDSWFEGELTIEIEFSEI